MSELIYGMAAARQRAGEFYSVSQQWLKACSLAIMDACRAVGRDPIPLWHTHSPIGAEMTFDVSLKGGSYFDFGRAGIRLYTIEPYGQAKRDPNRNLVNCEWIARFITLQSFLRRVIHRLKQKGLRFDAEQFRSLVALYLLTDGGSGVAQ